MIFENPSNFSLRIMETMVTSRQVYIIRLVFIWAFICMYFGRFARSAFACIYIVKHRSSIWTVHDNSAISIIAVIVIQRVVLSYTSILVRILFRLSSFVCLNMILNVTIRDTFNKCESTQILSSLVIHDVSSFLCKV